MCNEPSGCNTIADSSGGILRSDTRKLFPGGSKARQFEDFSISVLNLFITLMGGRFVLRLSPQVVSKSTSMSQNSREIDPLPLTCQGFGPSSIPRMPTENSPAPNTFTDIDAEISM